MQFTTLPQATSCDWIEHPSNI